MNKKKALAIFDELWLAFNIHYALFKVKNINWQHLKYLYKAKINDNISESDLFELCSDMLGMLNDNHVRLKMGEVLSRSGLLGEKKEAANTFSRELIKKRFLGNTAQLDMGSVFFYGKLPGNIGYVHFDRFHRRNEALPAFERIMKKLFSCKAYVIDVRANMGGDDLIGKAIADYFADDKRLYMITRTKNGAGNDDFAAPRKWFVENRNLKSSGKPVVLLTDRTSISAAENFALAFKVMPNSVIVGDITSGCYADSFWKKLSNGWETAISFKLFTDGAGYCYEGLGVPPDYRVLNNHMGNDNVLETALELIKYHKGTLRPFAQPVYNGSSALSLEDEYEKISELMHKGQHVEAEKKASQTAQKNPKRWMLQYLKARAQVLLNKDNESLDSLKKADKLLNVFFPWESDCKELFQKILFSGWSQENKKAFIEYKPRFLV